MAGSIYSQLHLQRVGGLVLIEPSQDGKAAGPSLTVDLNTGTIGLTEHSLPLQGQKGCITVLGVIGLLRLKQGSALAVITGAKQVATVHGHPAYRVTSTRVLSSSTASGNKDDARFVDLLETALSPAWAGDGLFFSHHIDLTLSQQRYAAKEGAKAAGAKAALAAADPHFHWNRYLSGPLLEGPPEAARFVVPLVMGSLQQLPEQALPGSTPPRGARLTLIARRSVGRPGVRHWRRGADPQGDVANFVETEQLVEITGGKAPVTSSYVLIRGSIPLLWSSIPNIKYKPATKMAPLQASDGPFDRHIRELLEVYQGVTAINLANAHGSEGSLGQAFISQNDRFAQHGQGLRLVPFDFHAVCGSTRYERMSVLWEEVKQDFERFGWWLEGEASAGTQKQRGTFRVNCIDCLDRTNVVQGYFARRQLEAVLRHAGVLQAHGSLPADLPQFEARFKVVWANHGDAISRQYAGTGALKSGFTRTGKRTFGGKLDDGWKSLTRYYLNNFQDGRKQDALDLVTGTFRIQKDQPSPFHTQASPAVLISIILASLFLALRGAVLLLTGHIRGQGAGAVLAALAQQVVLPVLAAGVILALVVKNGKALVCRPQLCPKLTQPW